MYINDELVIDAYYPISQSGEAAWDGVFFFPDLELYPVRIEWRQNTGAARLKLEWARASTSDALVPKTHLHASSSHIQSSPFTIEFTEPEVLML